jgi:hypothetical protein
VSAGPTRGFSARGSLGQYLVVLPKKHLVAVRMRAPGAGEGSKHGPEKDRYPGFADDVARLF